MTLEVLKLKQVTESKQDGSREFISCLAYIFAIGRWILLLLIYKGESGSLISTWVNLVDIDAQAHFTVSYNKWLNNAISLAWLKTVFERYTKLARITQKRLLIADRHSSHINIAFVD